MPSATDSGLRRLFDDAVTFMRNFLRAERVTVLFNDARSGDLVMRAAFGLEVTRLDVAPISLSVIEKVLQTRQPILSADAQRDEELESSSLLISGVRSVMCVPIMARDKSVQGVLYADSRVDTLCFTRPDLVRITSYARETERRLDIMEGEEPVPVMPLYPVVEAAPPPQPRPEQRPSHVPAAAPARPASRKPISLRMRESVVLLRSLASLLNAGIPVARSLHVLESQSDTKAAREVAAALRQDVETGMPLSSSLARSCNSFSNFHIKLLKVGEATGGLIEVLDQLSAYEERRRAFQLRLLSALTYPCALFVLCFIMMVAGAPYLLRGQLQVIQQLGGEVPLLTRIMFSLADLRVIAVLILVPIVATIAVTSWARTPAGSRGFNRILLAVPKLGDLFRLAAVTRFAQALALQLKCGLSLLEAVPNAAGASGNPLLEDQIQRTLVCLRDGMDVKQSLEASRFFPPGFLAIVGAGEETGKVPETLQWVSRLYETELEAALEMTAAAMEPMMMMLMGMAAALVALATLLPMVKVVQTL